jgi:fibro-slime domain-containing protein
MELEASFVQTVSGLDAWGHDIIFDFTGDDDFWLYVDGELVIDLGGIHSALKGTVNFRTGEVYVNGTKTTLYNVFKSNYQKRGLSATEIEKKLAETFDQNSSGQYIFRDYTTHTMKIFYMERGAGASNLHMRFNLASVIPGNVVVNKKVTGDGAENLDWDFIEYPFQIYYTAEGEDGQPGPEQLLGNDDEHVCITYQNSNKPVTFVKKYRPPGVSEADAYENIYFINPTRNAEISFPDNTISYRIVECAVDTTVYGNVLINGENVPEENIERNGHYYSYSSEIGTAEKKPSISFENVINDNVIKELYITKKLVDEEGHEITGDPATFSFRLRISATSVEEAQIPLANMYSYYVLSPDKKLCSYDYENGTFAETSYAYSREVIQQIKKGEITDVLPYDVTFTTSGFGAISGIPAGYTIVVPGLPVGSVFKVTEDIKPGYGLKDYDMVMGEKVNEDETHEPIPSYYQYGSSGKDNVGQVRVEENPQMEVINEKGYGLMVYKRWNDLNLTTAHQPIYTAVYVDGELLSDSVRQIKSSDSSVYYFWSSLKPYANGDERLRFDGYTVREVTLSNADPTVAADGKVTDYGTVTLLEGGDTIRLSATRTAAATPEGETAECEYDYVVSYATTTSEDGTVQTDTIKNTRKGGIAVRLFKWDSEDPLQGGSFTLTDNTGTMIGTYTSDSDGIVTMLYSFERNKIYTLTQTAATKGYVGLKKQLCFMINDDDTVSLFYSDGTTVWGTLDEKDSPWADGKIGSSGITSFVDIYNKPFQFKVVKTDSANPDVTLDHAHFALSKQMNSSIGEIVKSDKPMPGFEDMVTRDGEILVCGGNSGRVINPGPSGTVYYLTETEAPQDYEELVEDIVFRISALGVPSLISDSYNGQLVETDDSFTYTLSVPNVRETSDKMLIIRKVVEGNFGNKSKEFTFTITVTGAGENLTWTKNGAAQTAIASSGGSFTMGHGDVVAFQMPAGCEVKVTEDNEDYKTTIKLGDAAVEEIHSKKFTVTEDTTLLVTNTRDGIVPTGVWVSFGTLFGIGAALLLGIAFIMRMRRKRITEEFLQRMRDLRS